MITKEKLSIYGEYGGYYDGYIIQNYKKPSRIISDEEWVLIERLMHDVYLVQNNLASEEYGNNLQAKLSEVCENKATIKYFKELALSITEETIKFLKESRRR